MNILFEDDYIICVSKPNNIVVHHAYYSRNVSQEDSLLELLFIEFGCKFYPIHRLDRKTSGIILLAKQTKYVSKFQELFTTNKIDKTYYGIVRGHSPASKVIDSPVKGKDSDVYKQAETSLKTMANITIDIPVKPYESSRYSLVEMKPTTGKLHQLRIHMNKISHPLIGDAKYGDKNHNTMFIDNFNCENLFLHAYSLEFIHPFSKEELLLISSFPNDWNIIFKRFEWFLNKKKE